jgi:fatty acid desaturase
MTIRNEYARIVRRARAGYEENRREVIGSSLFTTAIVLAALSYALSTGTSVLMSFTIALTWFVIGAVTIGMLMVTDVPKRPRRRR